LAFVFKNSPTKFSLLGEKLEHLTIYRSTIQIDVRRIRTPWKNAVGGLYSQSINSIELIRTEMLVWVIFDALIS